ncbi:hypothetical protein Daura_35155 [Dactylosporangium aurantiacum]|uniref:Lipoprotein n=1 Tax=Dactylosporangium aurantiacum TaxID=35754 RepID=A0A9Q9IEF5_9ACTN|nr:hypothetical protein [Dactylosporangium aurantiacum]MDG6103588.1 hypothetical protein [Dactylosporangium aurantiacum]UWZ51919.1 hypothetical protein Daura_35155 [Dactylosporangium aurantiacum]
MKRLALSTLLVAVLGTALAGCGEDAADTPAAQSTQQSTQQATQQAGQDSTYPKTDEGAKALLQALPKDPALVRKLKPTTEDYQALFAGDVATKAERFYATNLWNGDAKVGGDAAQTELKLFKATSEEIRSWSSAVEANFPGGYQQIGPHLKPGLTWYRWKYTEPGKDTGMAYEGLVHVNGHWVWAPKPWKALEG